MDFSTLQQGEARIEYLSGDYKILKHGSYVTCAVTGKPIPLDELRYWNFGRQEAYLNCEVSYQRELECDPHLRNLIDNLETSS